MICDDFEVFFPSIYQEIVINDLYNLRRFFDRPVDRIIDIGANYGLFSIYARCLFPEAEIFSIEPNPKTFQGLVENTRGLHIKCANVALGDGKHVRVSVNPYNGASGSIAMLPDETGEVQSAPLPELLNAIGCVVTPSTIFKFDCEGGERVIIDDSERCMPLLGNCLSFTMETHHGETNQGLGYPPSRWLQWLREEFGVRYRHRRNVFSPLRDGTPENNESKDFAILQSYVP